MYSFDKYVSGTRGPIGRLQVISLYIRICTGRIENYTYEQSLLCTNVITKPSGGILDMEM